MIFFTRSIMKVLFILPLTHGNYTLTCPTKEQWSLRSSSRCNDTSYYCLWDLYTDGYREQCMAFPSRDTKGYRKVFAGNVDGIECAPDTYQPFKFWTNESSDCVYKKSLCTGEGQVVQDDGSNEVDRGCRCDYRYGYNYVTKPRGICNCVPSEEDCSCYRMSCPEGHLLTPDYECRKMTEWKQTFGCPDISVSRPDEESTVIVKIVISKDTDQPASSRIAVPLFVLLCLVLIIGLLVLWMLCKPCKHEENIEIKTVYIETPEVIPQNIRENIEIKTVYIETSEVIPQNIRESQQKDVEKWKSEDDNFVPTRAAYEVLQSIRKNQCVIITGPLGCGKTFTAHHVILELMEHDGYSIDDILLVIDQNDIKRYAKREGKQILFIDDICGKYSISQDVHEWWSRNSCLVEYFLTKNTELKIIATCRSDIYNLIKLNFIRSHCAEVSFLLEELTLCIKERRQIGEKHLGDVIDGFSDEVLMRYDFFPALCAKTSKSELTELDIPVTFLADEIDNMYKHLDAKFLSLALFIIFMNKVKTHLFQEVPVIGDIISSTSREIGMSPAPSIKDVQRHVVALKGSFVTEVKHVYSIKTEKLYDILMFCLSRYIMKSLLKFGQLSLWKDKFMLESLDGHSPPLTILIPQEYESDYFDRLLSAIRKGLFWRVFSDMQNSFEDYRRKLIDYMTAKINKDDLARKSDNESTILHVIATQGFTDYLKFFLGIDRSGINQKDSNGKTPLYYAAVKGHADTVKLLMDKGSLCDITDNDGNTPLDMACIGGHSQTVSTLLSNKSAVKQNPTTLNTALHIVCRKGNQELANVILSGEFKDVKIENIIYLANEHGYTPLHEAVMKGHLEITKMLINKNASINCKDNKYRTPLYYACKINSLPLVKVLVEHGANPLIGDKDDKLPLHVSCENGNTDIIDLLLSKVKDGFSDKGYRKYINSCDNVGNTPLYLACFNNQIQAVELILLQRVDVNLSNSSYRTPIHVAVAGGFIDICSSLIDYKADVNCLNKDKQTPLHFACHAGHVDIVKLLLSNGAILDVQDKDQKTPLHLSSLTGNIDIAKLLLEKELLIKREPALLHMKDNYDMLPIFIACLYGHNELVQYYIDLGQGSEINYKNKDGQTPLFIACQEGHIDVVRVLLNARVNVCEADHDGWSPLFVACKGDRQDIVTLLINHGAVVNQTTITDGDSPLHQTSASGNETLSALLVKHGALVNLQNVLGETPLWKASLSEHKNMMKYLLQQGAKVDIQNKNGFLLMDHPRIKLNQDLFEILSS